MLKVDNQAVYVTRNGDQVELRYTHDAEPNRGVNEQWIVRQINAYIAGEHVGYLKISYIPTERFQKMFPDLVNYQFNSTFKWEFKIDTSTPVTELTLDQKRRLLISAVCSRTRIKNKKWDLGWHSQEEIRQMNEDQVDQYIAIINDPQSNIETKKRIDDIAKFHFDRPLVDFIRVNETHQRQGIGTILYQAGARWMMSEFGLYLHASGIQQPEAQAAWEKMTHLGWVISAPGNQTGKNRRVLNPKNF